MHKDSITKVFMIKLRITLSLSMVMAIASVSSMFAQVGGVSGGKINAFNHLPIPKGTAEFEPNYGFTATKSQWDIDGNKIPIFSSSDSTLIETNISFRMAYPITDRLEVGTFIAESFSNWSIKYALNGAQKFGYGIMGGINLPYGTTTLRQGNRNADQSVRYSLGVIGSYQLTESSSFDLNVQVQNYFSNAPDLPGSDVIVYLDFGHYISTSGVQLMSSISYIESSFEVGNAKVLSYYPGISLEMKDNYFIVINGAFDVMGKSSAKTSGFAIAWTMTL